MSDYTKKHDVELALWRSGLVSNKACPIAVESAARDICRASNTLRRINLEACNGVPKWNQSRQCFEKGLDESDQARHETQTRNTRKNLESAARDVLKRGIVFNFYTDPRAGCACRIFNKKNTMDCFV